MNIRNSLMAAAFAGLSVALAHAAAQGQPQQPPAQQPPAQPPQNPPPAPGTPAPAPAGREQGRGRGPGVFPAMQRPPADPAVVERGKSLFSVNCSACHGVDARGGQLGGPNLLRSQLVLMDQNGEQIAPVVQNGRPERGMPPFPLGADDIKAIAEFIHSLTAASQGQGSPPPTDLPPVNILVGDAAAGQAFFAAKCSGCHSPTGDLQGIATKVPDPKTLQNLWVSGGLGGGRGRGRGGNANGPVVTVTVTQPSGEKVEGRLLRIDDFLVSLVDADGSVRTFRRDGDVPKVEMHDPLEGHKSLLGVYTDKDMHDVTAYLVTLK
jgi:cytochrome c oxidase cbb3-type subunit 3